MLTKLIKYDFKKMIRILVYFYAIGFSLAVITRLISLGKDMQFFNILGYIFAGFTYAALANILVNTFVHILMAFTKSFYKDESYLTHTLPVKKSSLLLSKYISALLVVLCSMAVCFACLFTLFYSPEFMQGLSAFIQGTIANFSMPSWLFVLFIVLILFTQVCAMLSMGFTAIIKGYSYNLKRGVKGTLWFILFYFASMLVTLALAFIACAIFGVAGELFANELSQTVFIILLVVALVCYIAFSIAYYFISKKLFEKGVNVD